MLSPFVARLACSQAVVPFQLQNDMNGKAQHALTRYASGVASEMVFAITFLRGSVDTKPVEMATTAHRSLRISRLDRAQFMPFVSITLVCRISWA